MASSVFIGRFPGIPWSTSGTTLSITGALTASSTITANDYVSTGNGGGIFIASNAVQFRRNSSTADAEIYSNSAVKIKVADLRSVFVAGHAANLAPTAFASLPAGSEGDLACVTDSNTATWGATIAGGGANNVLAFFNGTNWTVAGA